MKLSCKVIEDILPMYYDKVCSNETAELIDEHLNECPRCSHILSELHAEIATPQKNVDDIKPLKRIQKSYKKTRMRWLISILTILTLIPIAFLGWNEYSAQGVAYSNQNELACGNAFMTCLMEGDYTKAYTYLDIEAKKHAWLTNWFKEENLVNMESDGQKKFCELGEKVEAIGGIDTYEYVGTSSSSDVDYRGNKVHKITYRIKFEETEQLFYVDVSKNGVSSFSGGGSFVTDPLAQFCMWGEYLWQDYQGCYYDPDLKQYVYYDKGN